MVMCLSLMALNYPEYISVEDVKKIFLTISKSWEHCETCWLKILPHFS